MCADGKKEEKADRKCDQSFTGSETSLRELFLLRH